MAENTDILRFERTASERAGTARIVQSEPVTAGEYGTWQLEITIGSGGINTGGMLKIDTDSDTDWGWPQLDDPAAPEYLSLSAPDGSEVLTRVLSHSAAELVNMGRPLAAGETLTLTYGDRAGGGPGSRSQTFYEDHRYFLVSVDAAGTGDFISVADSPELKISGGKAVTIVVVAPSQAETDRVFDLLVKAEDAWGNPASAYRGTVRLSGPGIDIPQPEVSFDEDCGGAVRVPGCRATETGVLRVEAEDTARPEVRGISNPVDARDEAPAHQLLWGDPHGGQVVDPRKIEGFLAHARDLSGIHFTGFQRNDHVMSNEAYSIQQEAEKKFYEPGRFVPLPGFEWSGDLESGGHHNVYYRRFDLPIRRSSHRGDLDTADRDTDLTHVTDLHREMLHQDVVITPHVGGVHADLQFHEPSLEPCLEIVSTHGQFEWFLRESIERKYKMGFVGGSDCYTSRPGDDRPGHQLRRYSKGGLTAVYTEKFDLPSILSAIKARRCYATSGARIIAAVSADGHMMGEEYSSEAKPEIRVEVHGTAPIERIEVFRGLDLLHTEELATERLADTVRVTWQGASRRSSYSGIIWDGSVTVTDGNIESVEKIRFDSPRSHIYDVTDNGLRWHSWMCGYRTGFLLTLNNGGAARLDIAFSSQLISGARYGGHGEAPPQRMSMAQADAARFSVGVDDLASGPRALDLGLLDRKFTVELAPTGGPRSHSFSFKDPSPAPGINPYWARVTQSDMEMAWTSPVFFDFAPDPLTV